jgi:hypothetical protein
VVGYKFRLDILDGDVAVVGGEFEGLFGVDRLLLLVPLQ